MNNGLRSSYWNNRWAVFISGGGSNLQVVLECLENKNIVRVFSSKSKAFGLLRAQRMGIPTEVLPTPIEWSSLNQRLLELKIDHLFLLGFMKIIPDSFIKNWSGKIYNLHPSVLPLHKGLHGFQKSLDEKKGVGATIHSVIADLDAGPIYLQKEINCDGRWSNKDQIKLEHRWSEQKIVRRGLERC